MSLSTGTLNLKFMQRGNQPNAGPSTPSTTKPTNRKIDPAQWVLPSASTSASAKGKGKATIQNVEFEGSYLPFLNDEDGSQSGGRRSFGLAVKPAPAAVPTPEPAPASGSTSKSTEVEDAELRPPTPPKTFIKPAGFDDVKPKIKTTKGKRKSDSAEIGGGPDEIVQGARAKKKPKKKVVKTE